MNSLVDALYGAVPHELVEFPADQPSSIKKLESQYISAH